MWTLLAIGCGGAGAPPIPIPPCPGEAGATRLVIAPYLQALEPTAVTILWETDAGRESAVWFGPTLEQRRCGELTPALGQAPPLHRVRLEGLEAGTRYAYQVQTGEVRSDVLAFTTPPAQPAPFNLVALADSQRDGDHPLVLQSIVEEGVLPTVRARYTGEPDADLAMVLFAGDLVEDGWLHGDWARFFEQGAALWGRVPLVPVAGNREGGSPLFDRYFELPDAHVYTLDRANVRVIGLDSNEPYRTVNQLAWLDDVLASTCDDPTIDFVFAQLHHPHLSELWTGAETPWTEGVVDRLATFSGTCGKPSIHFYGHTHGYARGADRDHQHLMVDVASAGGRLDRWGRDAQADREAIAVSEEGYGFVLVEVDGDGFEILRFSRGTPEAPLDNVLVDRFRLARSPAPPQTPAVHWACEQPPRAIGSAFSDPDGGSHQASDWRVTDCAGTPRASRWLQRQNRYGGVDLQADDDLTDATFDLDGPLCVRLRYRDDTLAWSAWSEPVARACP